MKLRGLLFLVLLLCLPLGAQQTYRARVVDAETGEALPYAIVRASKGNGVMADMKGGFCIKARKGSKLQVFNVGYDTKRIRVGNIGDTIYLRPMGKEDSADISANKIMENVGRRSEREYHRKEESVSNYIYQMTLQHGEWQEMNEAYMSAFSAINLRGIMLMSGRRLRNASSAPDDSLVSYLNLQHLIDGGPLAYESDFWESIKTPFRMRLKKKKIPLSEHTYSWGAPALNGRWYDYRIETLTGPSERKIYKLTFVCKPGCPTPILDGAMYVDAKNSTMLAFEGTLHNFVLELGMNYKLRRGYVEPDIRITYTHDRGFTEVESIVAKFQIGHVRSRTILFNLGRRKLPLPPGKEVAENILETIDRVGDWISIETDNEPIQYTDEEKRLIQKMVDYDE